MKPVTRIAAVALAVPLLVTGCGAQNGGAGQDGKPAGQSATQNDPFSVQPGTEVDKAAFLEQTQKALQEKKTYAMNMTMSAEGQQMNMTGDVDAADPANQKMKMKMEMPQQGGALNMIMDGEWIYVQIPGGDAGGKYVKVSLQQMMEQTGQDFKKITNPAENLKMQQEAIDKVTYVGEEDLDGAKARHYTAVLDMQKAMNLAGQTAQPVPTASGGSTKMPYELWVDGDKLMRRVTMDVQGAKVDVRLSKFGEPVDIQAPPAASVTTPPSPAGQQQQAPAPSSKG